MRKFIVIAGFVLASATAQAEPRSLSLAGSDVLATPAPAPARIADTPKTAEAPQAVEAPKTETPKTEAPKYIERPAAVETPKAEAPKADAPKVEQTTAEPTKPAKTARAEKPRHKRYWTEGRIISELHRHGVYW
jgi:outer membrane biosynthesis protein TonB